MLKEDIFNKVSKICYGTLSLSKLQCSYSMKEKLYLLNYAYDLGINFFDTAELYDNYSLIKNFLQDKDREKVFISTKSYSYNRETGKKSLEKALKEMDTDYVDIFMLHEQEGLSTFKGHYEAVRFFLECKDKGVIKKFGISTHFIKGVEEILDLEEIDIIHPIINIDGIGIADGTRVQMEESIKKAKTYNKFILSMKPFGGGHLSSHPVESLKYVKSLDFIDSIAVGMRYKEEIDFNFNLLEKDNILKDELYNINKKERKLKIAYWCKGCGQCVEKCNQNALKMVNGKAEVDFEKCTLCSYCVSACEEFCIKIV
ncbi:MAG: aldo/keto reductase [Bacillota bacterium]|nr:aldo/keto reductase [Bacillota bacterium]